MNEAIRTSGRGWTLRDYSLLVFTFGLAAWTVRAELIDIFQTATRDNEQSHILLVPVVAGWLVWLRRARLRHLRCRPSLLGPAAIVAGWTLVWFGHETDTYIARHVGALVVLVGAVLAMTGLTLVRQMLPALLVFAFMVPVPGTIRQQIALPLQNMAAVVTGGVLDVLGVAAEREGNRIIVQGQAVAVGEACNGMRMVFALTLVVYAFVFSVPFRRGTKVTLLILSPAIALLCNVIRLVPTAFVYGYGAADVAEQFHDLAGWVMLPIALGMLIVVLRTIEWLELPVMSWRLAR